MDRDAREALRIIRDCIRHERFRLLEHFAQRMAERGMVWPDIMAVVDDPREVRGDGVDDWARPRWIIRGETPDGLDVGIVCVIGHNDDGTVTVFVTLFWEG